MKQVAEQRCFIFSSCNVSVCNSSRSLIKGNHISDVWMICRFLRFLYHPFPQVFVPIDYSPHIQPPRIFNFPLSVGKCEKICSLVFDTLRTNHPTSWRTELKDSNCFGALAHNPGAPQATVLHLLTKRRCISGQKGGKLGARALMGNNHDSTCTAFQSRKFYQLQAGLFESRLALTQD